MRREPPDARRGKVHSLALARTDHLVRDLRSKLEDYLHGDEAAPAVRWGMTRFFPVELFEEVEPEAHDLAVDWVAFVFPNEWKVPLARQLADDDVSLSPAERATLYEWADRATPGFFRVTWCSGRQAGLVRIPDDAPFVVRGLSGRLQPGDVLATWLLPTGTAHYLGLRPMALREDMIGGLCHILQVEMELFRRQQPHATWDDLYRASWPRIVWFLGILVSGADVTPIQAPPGPSVVWDGRPVEGAPAWWQETASRVRESVDLRASFPEEPADGAERLWWDAVLTLRPKQARPDGWAAGVVYAFRRYVLGDPTVTQAEVAGEFGVTAATVGNRSRQVVSALGLQMYDLRYVDLLARDVRIIWEVDCIGALGTPGLYGGIDVSKMSPEDKLILHAVLRDMAWYLTR